MERNQKAVNSDACRGGGGGGWWEAVQHLGWTKYHTGTECAPFSSGHVMGWESRTTGQFPSLCHWVVRAAGQLMLALWPGPGWNKWLRECGGSGSSWKRAEYAGEGARANGLREAASQKNSVLGRIRKHRGGQGELLFGQQNQEVANWEQNKSRASSKRIGVGVGGSLWTPRKRVVFKATVRWPYRYIVCWYCELDLEMSQ